MAETSDAPPTEQQWQIIKDHLQLVFKKETPNYNPVIPKRYEDLLKLSEPATPRWYDPTRFTSPLITC
ncbi:hypothetical protein D3C87_2054460 [compost metagenome]